MKTHILLNSEKNQISLNKNQALQMELALNLSTYAKTWSDIGDKLYNFSTGNMDDNIIVTDQQYQVLLKLLKNKTK